jgi:hypothetical protein
MAAAQESIFLDSGAVVLGCSAIAALYFRQAAEPYMVWHSLQRPMLLCFGQISKSHDAKHHWNTFLMCHP